MQEHWTIKQHLLFISFCWPFCHLVLKPNGKWIFMAHLAGLPAFWIEMSASDSIRGVFRSNIKLQIWSSLFCTFCSCVWRQLLQNGVLLIVQKVSHLLQLTFSVILSFLCDVSLGNYISWLTATEKLSEQVESENWLQFLWAVWTVVSLTDSSQKGCMISSCERCCVSKHAPLTINK